MKFTGDISQIKNAEFPFLVTVTDEAGNFFGTFPAKTLMEAEIRLADIFVLLSKIDRPKPPHS